MICDTCGTTLEFRFFPRGRYVCPVCGEKDTDDEPPHEHDEEVTG